MLSAPVSLSTFFLIFRKELEAKRTTFAGQLCLHLSLDVL